IARKNKTVSDLTKGIAHLFKKNGIDSFVSWAKILAPGRIALSDSDLVLEAKNILIATGSEPIELPMLPFDGDRIVDSTGALSLSEVPEDLVVIGAGVIGLELGQVWARLGAKVTIVEAQDQVLPGSDAEVSKLMKRALSRQGITFKLGRTLKEAKEVEGLITLNLTRENGKSEEVLASKVLVAIGRRPVATGLGLEALGIKTNERGFIVVDEAFATSVPGIFAIGDCVPGPMLAHKAEKDGVLCVEGIVGAAVPADYNAVPGVVYTSPEVAMFGATEERLVSEGQDFKIGKFPFIANSRARATGETEGLVKVLADPDGHILGAHIVNNHADDLITELVLAKKNGLTVQDISCTTHAHPALSEAVKEACLDVFGQAVHI
ncbi:MAG: dihydrolipoyl dehydrogenase, partial [Pseudomonadota bacterium]